MNKLERAKQLAKAIELTVDSLTPHIEATHKKGVCHDKKCQKQYGSLKFHRQAVREYADILLTLARELEKQLTAMLAGQNFIRWQAVLCFRP